MLRPPPEARIRFSWNGVAYASILHKLFRLSRQGRIEGVYVRHVELASFLLRVRRLLGVPLVYEVHGTTEREEGKEARVQRRVMEGADGLVAISGALREQLLARYNVESPVCVAHDGVDPEKLHPATDLTGEPVVCYVGNFWRVEGVEVLLEALKQVPEARVILVGGVPGAEETKRVRALVQEHGTGGRVTMVGHLPHKEAMNWLRSSRVAVAPLLETHWTRCCSPLKLFEYMAAGIPVVVSDLPSVREVVDDGECALLSSAGDPGALASAIRRVLTDDALAERLRANALKRVKQYSWERRASRIIDFLSREVVPRWERESVARAR